MSFRCPPGSLDWELILDAQGDYCVKSFSPSIRFSPGRKTIETSLSDWELVAVETLPTPISSLGALDAVKLVFQTSHFGLQAELNFALAQETPFFVWKINLQNTGSHSIWLDSVTLLDTSSLALGEQDHNLAFFSNGWQSWSRCGVYGPGQAQPQTRIGRFQATQNQNPGTPYIHQKNHYSSDFFGILGNRESRVGLLAGFLSQKEQFGSIEARTNPGARLKIWANGDHSRLDPGAAISTDWAVLNFIHLDEPDPQGLYFDTVAKEHGIAQKITTQAPLGWCSWYEFYQNISEDTIRQNLKALLKLQGKLPLTLLQIDDGFERQPGDWFTFRQGFPNGVKPLAHEIHAAGLMPGLWLAPFIVHPQANLEEEHPEFLLRDRYKKPVSAGYIWDRFTHALDLTVPGALDYVCQVVHTAVKDWGFSYLKLDFLYAAAMKGIYHDPTRTRAQVLRSGLEALHKAAGEDTFLLGCGVPLGSSIGLFDAMRIGTDVSGDWLPKYRIFSTIIHREPHVPSARNALQNIFERAHMHRRWWVNDPDCLILRPDANLTLEEIQTLASSIALTGGSLLLSDNLPTLPPERLRIAENLLPVIRQPVQILDWFDRNTPSMLRLDMQGATGPWYLLAYINWDDKPQDVGFSLEKYGIPEGEYLARDFWQQRNLASEKDMIRYGLVPAHGTALISVRQRVENQPLYLGSDLHITQGMEVSSWISYPGGIDLEFDLPRRVSGQISLWLPRPVQSATQDGHPIPWLSDESCSRSCYLFRVAFEAKARIQICY